MSDPRAIFDQVPGWDVAKLRAARVMVIGAGALGNEVLKNLALLGIGQVVIVDFDRVEPHNLSRSVLFRPEDAAAARPKTEAAADQLRAINPDMDIKTLNADAYCDLGLGLIRRMDVVIGCVDNRLARLYINRLCHRVGKSWVDGGILNLSGQAAVYVPGHSCYECGLTAAGWKDIRARMGCMDMVQRYAVAGRQPTTPLAAALIGAVMVQEAMKIVFRDAGTEPDMRMFSYDGEHLHAAFYDTLPNRAECDSHYSLPEIHALPEATHDITIASFFHLLEVNLGLTDPVLYLDHPVATALAGQESKYNRDVLLPQPKFSEAVAASVRKVPGERIGIPKNALLDRVRKDFAKPDVPLWALGIPVGHILKVKAADKGYWIELTGDAKRISEGGRTVIRNPWWEHNPITEKTSG